MLININLFTRILVLLLLVLIPVVILYVHGNRLSLAALDEDLRKSHQERVYFLSNQIEQEMDQLSILAGLLVRDPMIQAVEFYDLPAVSHEDLQYIWLVRDKIRLNSIANKWDSEMRLFIPAFEYALSKEGLVPYDAQYVRQLDSGNWTFRPFPRADSPDYRFVKTNTEPFNRLPAEASWVVEASFSPNNLQRILEQVNRSGRGETFLYHKDFAPIVSFTGEHAYVKEVGRLLDALDLSTLDETGRLNHSKLLIHANKIKALDWYVVDYVLLEEVLQPIRQSSTTFYLSMSGVTLVGSLAAILLYRQIQLPIRQLMRAIRRMKQGDYSIRLSGRYNSEFDHVFLHYNEMAEQIETLIEKVYKEEIRSREATLKQLQAQINPHFLYNCLYFIMNAQSLGDDEAVRRMALNLGQYYRYTTRMENQLPTIGEELAMVENYLTIINLRMKRLTYTIEVPDAMHRLQLPRLLLQPLAENAVIHGIEPKVGEGHIRITGERTGNRCSLIIEDDGIGMSTQALEALKRGLEQPMTNETGCGVWNVHQRLQLEFGRGSGLELHRGESGGMRVVMHFTNTDRIGEGE